LAAATPLPRVEQRSRPERYGRTHRAGPLAALDAPQTVVCGNGGVAARYVEVADWVIEAHGAAA
jgi:hypothetical protein